MKQYIGLIVCLGLLAGCATDPKHDTSGMPVKSLTVRWQRLVDESGQTCGRCGLTETAVANAVGKLKRSLGALGINVDLEKEALSRAEFAKGPLESNRIWIGGEPLEKWLSATSSQSVCGSACGGSECRTVMVEGKAYEAIPAELIIKAGLLAGAQLIHGDSGAACCPQGGSSQGNPACRSSSQCGDSRVNNADDWENSVLPHLKLLGK